MTFPEKLKSERARLGLTQAQADTLLGLGKGQMTAWETGRNVPHPMKQDGVLGLLRKIKPRKK